jgi:hypothetical protein
MTSSLFPWYADFKNNHLNKIDRTMAEDSEQAIYQIVVQGRLASDWSDWLGQMRITYDKPGCTVLTGPVLDQAALHGILLKIRDLNLVLLAVNRIHPADD